MSFRPAPDGAIRPIESADTWDLRGRVLRPGQPLAACRLPGDEVEGAFHLGAFDSDGALLGVASFHPEAAPPCLPELAPDTLASDGSWRLRGMATAPAARGRGHGAALLRAGLTELARRGGRLLWCNARLSAVDFYARQGLARAGADFDIPGIGGHVVMWRELPSG